jgi:hypothetical protein
MSIYEASITNPKKQLEFYKDLSEQLQRENKKIKKQLEECYCNRTDCSSRIKNSKKYDSLVQTQEAQQKEFINYLEAEINKCQSNIFADGVKYGFQLSLSKYKEIIGELDDKID